MIPAYAREWDELRDVEYDDGDGGGGGDDVSAELCMFVILFMARVEQRGPIVKKAVEIDLLAAVRELYEDEDDASDHIEAANDD